MEYVDPILRGTVWFLGAGFSRGLGAPLFRELFMSDRRIKAAGIELPERAFGVLALYRRYCADSPEVLWRDPEEFIEVLESARKEGRARKLLVSATDLDIDSLVDDARRILAIECSQFLRGASTETERWLPYRKWASQLDEKHTVISFNYDRVLEVLQKDRFREETNNYSVIVPREDERDEAASARQMKCAPVLKLHGSVDWIVKSGKLDVDASDDLAGTAASGSDIVLAVPGPDKGEIGSRFKEIGQLWRAAETAVQRARRIVFLGYRFPVTDTRARLYFLDAMRFAIKGNSLRTVEIVLGPDDKHPDVARMNQLLSFVCDGSLVVPKVLPLYVEDYLPFSASEA